MEDRVPPQNIEAEQSVLGSILMDKDAIISVASILKPEYFYKDAHGDVFKSMLILFDKREPIDLVTLSNSLSKQKILDKVGGRTYLTQLANVVPTSAHIEHYAQIVKDSHTRRELIKIGANLTQMSFDEKRELYDLLDASEQSLFSISQEHLDRNFSPIKGILENTFERLDELHKTKGKLRGLPTGFGSLDNKLAGFQKSNLIILAARPSQGKTSLALNIAQNAVIKEKRGVGIFSLEMSKEQLVDRLLAAQADVDAWRITTGSLTETDFQKIGVAMGQLAEAPLYIDDTPDISVMEIRTKARRLQMEKEVDLIVVDYLQLVRGPNRESRVQEVSEISRSLKALARELNCPVLAISQLSRAIEARGEKKPQLSDLRESGSIEQDADVVMFLYREDNDNPVDIVKLLIAKHRNGPTGEIEFTFRGERTRFYEVDKNRNAQ